MYFEFRQLPVKKRWRKNRAEFWAARTRKGGGEREVFGEDEEGRDGEADQRRRLRIRNRQESRHGFSDPPQHAHVPRFSPIYKQIRIRVSSFQLGLMERVFVLNVVDCPFGTRIAESKL